MNNLNVKMNEARCKTLFRNVEEKVSDSGFSVPLPLVGNPMTNLQTKIDIMNYQSAKSTYDAQKKVADLEKLLSSLKPKSEAKPKLVEKPATKEGYEEPTNADYLRFISA